MHRHAILPILTVAMIGLHAVPAEAQLDRSWVGSEAIGGNDTNPCTRTAPCKSFQGAHTKTNSGGEINCIDAADYGTVFTTKSITIDCEGTFGSILAQNDVGISIQGAGVFVNVRNIAINCFHPTVQGFIGIRLFAGALLNVHNVKIFNCTRGAALGIMFSPNSGNATLLVTNSSITANGITPSTAGGIAIQPQIGGSARVTIENSKIQFNTNGLAANSTSGPITMTVRDSVISSNRAGIVAAGANAINMLVERSTINNNIATGINSAGAASVIRLDSSKITGNGTGIATQGGGVIHSFGNNAIAGNGTDGTPTQQIGLK